MKFFVGILITVVGLIGFLGFNYSMEWTIQNWQYWAFTFPGCCLSGSIGGYVTAKL